ncbi:MAG TPA: hypothetical protein VFY23_00500 [Candidatus Limnocylindrales bacterium]|nr:hypothetical protein [Candidatus Limnocylindrales bacterium]
MTRREPRFRFAGDGGSPVASTWSRARAARAARAYVVTTPPSMSVKPIGIRATRTVRRDGTRPGTTTLVRGWRR